MERRNFIRIGASGAAVIALSSFNAVAFTHNKLLGGGGGGGGGWGAIAKEFKAGMTVLAKQSQVMLSAIASLVRAAGFKDEAAVLEAEAERIKEKGTLSNDDFDSISAKTNNAMALVEENIKSGKVLTAKQKLKMGEAFAKYVPAVVKGVLGAVKIGAAAAKAGSAGTPGMSDGLAIINLAKDLPTLGPAAASWASNTVTATNKFRELMNDNGVAVTEKVKMPNF